MLVDHDLASAAIGPAPRPAIDIRRMFGLSHPSGGAVLPPELRFLAAQGVAPSLLHRAARAARRTGVDGEAALFGLGFSDERYAMLLARHLGTPYLEQPLPLDGSACDVETAAACGWAPLAPNSGNIGHVFAPRGAALRLLLDTHGTGDVGTYGFATTTRRRFEALLRHHEAAAFCERASSGLARWDPALSARGGVAAWQSFGLLGLGAAMGWAVLRVPEAAQDLAAIALFLVFTCAVAQRLLVAAAAPPRREPGRDSRMPDHRLPVYTIVVPLFREARILKQLVGHLDALDYPRAKLDIKLMLEGCDTATIDRAARLALPSRYDVIVLPDGHPRTKPRALNAALERAHGDLVVVYDAEDRPDPGQLRAAAARFADAPSDLACLQARLVVDHADESWITRMFALDYAALFQIIKPGLAALGLPIPLGGTSNHFRVSALRRVGGWDAWNVTEDIDLGYRLARFGFRVGSLDSDTYEEAPLTLARWMPQRSRWLKGWMVTLIVLSRDPVRAACDLGWRASASIGVSLLGTVLSCLFGPACLALLILEGWAGHVFRPETPHWWLWVAAAAALFGSGAAAMLWPIVAGLRRMGRLDMLPWLSTLPIYLLLVSLAGWRALYELWRDPQGWNKTEHGLSAMRPRSSPA